MVLVGRHTSAWLHGIATNSHFAFGLVGGRLRRWSTPVLLREEASGALGRRAAASSRIQGRNDGLDAWFPNVSLLRSHQVLNPAETSMSTSAMPELDFFLGLRQIMVDLLNIMLQVCIVVNHIEIICHLVSEAGFLDRIGEIHHRNATFI